MYSVVIIPQDGSKSVNVTNLTYHSEYTNSSGVAFEAWQVRDHLQSGDSMYVDVPPRSEVWPDGLPSSLYGNKWITTDNDTRAFNKADVIYSFDVDKPVDVYIVLDKRMLNQPAGPPWFESEGEPVIIAPPSGWKEKTTGFAAAFLDNGTTRLFKIFSAEFKTGEEVVIPGDKATNTDRAFHSVIIDGAKKDDIADFQSHVGLAWAIKDNLQNGDVAYTDRAPAENHMRWVNVSSNLLGKTWISTPVDAKNQKVSDIATFTAPSDIQVYLLVDARANILPWEGTDSEKVNYVDYLNFTKRDNTPLPELPAVYEATPYGNLKLVDLIDSSTSLDDEIYPYMESKIGGNGDGNQANKTPGIKADIQVNSILGRQARETMDYSWFGYRLGRGKLEPGKTYLIRFEYPEDKDRVFSIDIAAGQHFSSLSWRTGEDVAGDPYGTWPLSGRWQYHDVILPLDEDTQGSGGADDGNAENGVWVFVLNKRQDNGQGYFATYDGGPAIASIKLYEIAPDTNAPEITLPEGLPQRTLMLDWEREPTQEAEAIVNYAKLMGYSAISPTLLKWGYFNYGSPVAGYHSLNASETNYWIRGIYDPAKPGIVPEALPGEKTTHEKFLDATKGSGINYIPRIEFNGSLDLNARAETKPVNKNGEPAKANRTPNWVTNILHPDTYNTFKTYLDYIRIMREGDFTAPFPASSYYNKGADWALWPEVYNGIGNVQVFAPINILPYASDEFINYFRTTEGLAVSNVIEYDEIAQRSINPKYTSAVTQLPGPHSMELELLSYYYGDVTTLTFSTYTYSRGFNAQCQLRTCRAACIPGNGRYRDNGTRSPGKPDQGGRQRRQQYRADRYGQNHGKYRRRRSCNSRSQCVPASSRHKQCGRRYRHNRSGGSGRGKRDSGRYSGPGTEEYGGKEGRKNCNRYGSGQHIHTGGCAG